MVDNNENTSMGLEKERHIECVCVRKKIDRKQGE